VLLSSLDDEPKAIQAIHEGAQDYLIKDQFEPRKLMRALGNAVARTTNEETLTGEKDRAQATLNSIADAVISTDMSGNITFFNPIAGSMMGWPLKDAVGRHLTEVFRIIDATTHKPILDPMAKAASENLTGALPLNCVLIHRDGHEVFIEDSVAPIHDCEGAVTGAVIVFRDVSAARAQSEQMTHLAEHDSLTGLPNRLLFCDRVGQAIALARRHRGRAAVLFLDLDGFKRINDSLGHAAGDEFLKSVANRLLNCVRSPDTVCRHGGDEFVLLLQDVEKPEDVAATARRVLRAVAESYFADHRELHVTASIGVSIYPDDGLDVETLIRNADSAMYEAKKNGRQRFEFFKRDMDISTAEHETTEESLRLALERNEFTLHYQPKVDLKTGAIIGAEALTRWNHPTRGTILPGQFIPIAEKSGLILPIGAWVLGEACTQARAWADAGMPTGTVAVNISEIQLQNDHFLDELFETLNATGLDPESLELEVAESVLRKCSERTTSLFRVLRDMGVQVSVDNFGTGNSSLSSMRNLPVNAIKIDRSFVRQITTVPGGTVAVEAFIGMARSLHLRVVAEGVETAEDLEFLWAHDCDEAQGNFFSRPVPPDELAKLLRPN
jgi:diguanylate cyclase (GGDEF)-like protein/PAS domain S-box-containing protein